MERVCDTEDGHDDVCVGALYVGEERNDFVNNDHLVEAADQPADAAERVDPRLLHRVQQTSLIPTPRQHVIATHTVVIT